MSKMRISLTDKGGEIHGKVEIEGNYGFTREALLTTLESVAKSYQMDTLDLITDLYHTEKKLCQNATA